MPPQASLSPPVQPVPDLQVQRVPLSVTVVIPAYNEAERLPDTLQQLGQYLSLWARQAETQGQPFEILVVDDGSQDTTAEVVQMVSRLWSHNYPALHLSCIRHPQNMGKGAAMTTGILAAQRDWVLIYDADAATPIDELERFWSRILVAPEQARQTVFIGSRVHPNAHIQIQWQRRMVGRSFHTVLSLFFPWSHRLHDTQCGFKLMPTTLAQKLAARMTTRGYCWDVELLHRAFQQNIPVQELPVQWTHQPGSKVSLWRDPWGMLGQILQIRYASPHKFFETKS